jgi:hypothetical protein
MFKIMNNPIKIVEVPPEPRKRGRPKKPHSGATTEVVVKKIGRPPLSQEEKEKRAKEKRPVGRPKKTPEEKAKRKDNRPRLNGNIKTNGRAVGFSGWMYTMEFADGMKHNFGTITDMAAHFGVSTHLIRKLRDAGWDVGNIRKYDRDTMEQFENLTSVDVMNISNKAMVQRQKEENEARKQDEKDAKKLEALWEEEEIIDS